MVKEKDLDPAQVEAAKPSKCRYCGDALYWEKLPGNKKRPVDADTLEDHYCSKRGTK
jgi:hypothetical protein